MKKLPSEKYKSNNDSIIISSMIMIGCCLVCLLGGTWAWFTSNASVKSADLVSATYSVNYTVADKDGNKLVADEDGNYTLDPSVLYTVTLEAEGTASTGYASFNLEDKSYDSIQLAPESSISFLIGGWSSMTTASSWGTSAAEAPVKQSDEIYKEITVTYYAYGSDQNTVPDANVSTPSVLAENIENAFTVMKNIPAAPVYNDYKFIGWNTAADGSGDTVDLTKDTFTKDTGLFAIYEIEKVKIEFCVPARISDTDSSDYGKLDYANATVTSEKYTIGTEVTVPATDITYYEFLGWTTDTVTETVTTDTSAYTIVTPSATADSAATYYAVYKREAVYLEVLTEGTASIDRRGNEPGTWSDNFTDAEFTLDSFVSESSYRLWFVHVTPGFRVTAKSNPYTAKFFKVHGDGEITVTKSEGGYGTGTLITVTDKVTGETAEKFYVVIYGDVNGDTSINGKDVDLTRYAANKLNGENWATKGSFDHCKIMASNLYTPARLQINGKDYDLVKKVATSVATVDALTGTVS